VDQIGSKTYHQDNGLSFSYTLKNKDFKVKSVILQTSKNKLTESKPAAQAVEASVAESYGSEHPLHCTQFNASMFESQQT